MSKTPEQFNPQVAASERIDDKDLAEGMAYVEKPFRDTTIRRREDNQARYDYIHSDEYREHLRKMEEEQLQMFNDYVDHLDKAIRRKMASREEGKEYEAEELELSKEFPDKHDLLNEMIRRHKGAPEKERVFDEEKIQKIKDRYIRRFKEYLVWNEKRFEQFVKEIITVKDSDEGEFGEEEMKRKKDYENAPIPTGIRKAEDYKRTYLRRAGQKPLTKEEALKEASQVRERARGEGEETLKYAEILEDFHAGRRNEGWEEMMEYNNVRNFLNKPLNEHLRAQDYEEALEYVERLKEIPFFNIASWLEAQVKLKILEIKDYIRRRRDESK